MNKEKKEKKTHGVQLLLRAVVRDPDGKVITDTGRKPSRSFVIQFLEFLYGMARSDPVEATDVDNAESTLFAGGFKCNEQFNANGPVNVDGYGVVVGTGDTAETNTDYKLETQLTEGVGAGNITHGATVVEATAVVGANVDVEIKRAFTNLTGSAITVTEAGIYVGMTKAGWIAYHCIIRDVLAASVEVPDNCSLTIIYTLRTTV